MNKPFTPSATPDPIKPDPTKEWRDATFRWKMAAAMWTVACAITVGNCVMARDSTNAADARWLQCLDESTALREEGRMARRLATELPVCECSTVTTNHCVCIFADETVLTMRFEGTAAFYSVRKLP